MVMAMGAQVGEPRPERLPFPRARTRARARPVTHPLEVIIAIGAWSRVGHAERLPISLARKRAGVRGSAGGDGHAPLKRI